MTTKAKVYIVGSAFKGMTIDTFLTNGRGRYLITSNFDAADIMVLTGGSDINPAIYGQKPLSCTSFNNARDVYELEFIEKALKAEKFMAGICRGAQLLNCVPNEGTLWQDVNNHQGYHYVLDCVSGNKVRTNSVHHQGIRPTAKAEILAYCDEATIKKAEGEIWMRSKDHSTTESLRDVEAFWYPATRSFGYQAHPEFGDPDTASLFFDFMDNTYWGKEAGFKMEDAA